jgi:hypothetical protein
MFSYELIYENKPKTTYGHAISCFHELTLKQFHDVMYIDNSIKEDASYHISYPGYS